LKERSAIFLHINVPKGCKRGVSFEFRAEGSSVDWPLHVGYA
jgi:hypothetical protein